MSDAADGSYRPYPAYKASGVEWLGEVPGHWEVERLKFSAPIVVERFTGNAAETAYIALEHIESWTGKLISDAESTEVESNTASFRVGDVLFGKLRPYLAKVIRADIEGHCSTELVVLRTNGRIASDYLAYQLRSPGYIRWLDAMTYGTKMPRANPGQIGNSVIAFPPLPEQHAIAAFLDHKTAEIDTLIARNQELIDRLVETRDLLTKQAIIAANDRWLRMSYVVDQVARPIDRGDDIVYTPIGLYNWGRGIFHKTPISGSELGESDFFWIREGDLIFSGQFAWEGAVALASSKEEGCVASHRYPVVRGKPETIETGYLLAFFKTDYGHMLLDHFSRGAAGRNRPLNIGYLLKEPIPIPPLALQKEVSALVHLEAELREIVANLASYLQEYRTALIAIAVTGKIDVRNL